MSTTSTNTKLYYKTSQMSAYSELLYLMDVPDMGCTPDKVDVTVLTDTVRKYIYGLKEYGDLSFKFLYDNTSATSNYRILKGLQDTNTVANFKVSYPDGTSHSFDALVSVIMNSTDINGALTFRCNMTTQSDISTTNPA